LLQHYILEHVGLCVFLGFVIKKKIK